MLLVYSRTFDFFFVNYIFELYFFHFNTLFSLSSFSTWGLFDCLIYKGHDIWDTLKYLHQFVGNRIQTFLQVLGSPPDDASLCDKLGSSSEKLRLSSDGDKTMISDESEEASIENDKQLQRTLRLGEITSCSKDLEAGHIELIDEKYHRIGIGKVHNRNEESKSNEIFDEGEPRLHQIGVVRSNYPADISKKRTRNNSNIVEYREECKNPCQENFFVSTFNMNEFADIKTFSEKVPLWIPPADCGYKIYIIGLQECLDVTKCGEVIQNYLNKDRTNPTEHKGEVDNFDNLSQADYPINNVIENHSEPAITVDDAMKSSVNLDNNRKNVAELFAENEQQRYDSNPFVVYERYIGSTNTSLGFHGMISILIFVERNEVLSGIFQLLKVGVSSTAQGKQIIFSMPNKGGVGLAFRYYDTTFGVISCHLAADSNGKNRYWERLDQFKELQRDMLSSLAMIDQQEESLMFHYHHTIILGDMNFRIRKEHSDVLQMIVNASAYECERFKNRGTNCKSDVDYPLYETIDVNFESSHTELEGGNPKRDKTPNSYFNYYQLLLKETKRKEAKHWRQLQYADFYIMQREQNRPLDSNDQLSSRYAPGEDGISFNKHFFELIAYDELTASMRINLMAYDYNEASINFPPSFKYKVESNPLSFPRTNVVSLIQKVPSGSPLRVEKKDSKVEIPSPDTSHWQIQPFKYSSDSTLRCISQDRSASLEEDRKIEGIPYCSKKWIEQVYEILKNSKKKKSGAVPLLTEGTSLKMNNSSSGIFSIKMDETELPSADFDDSLHAISCDDKNDDKNIQNKLSKEQVIGDSFSEPDSLYSNQNIKQCKGYRCPSYTDRIIWRSFPSRKHRIKPRTYQACEAMDISDHKPVSLSLSVLVDKSINPAEFLIFDDINWVATKAALKRNVNLDQLENANVEVLTRKSTDKQGSIAVGNDCFVDDNYSTKLEDTGDSSELVDQKLKERQRSGIIVDHPEDFSRDEFSGSKGLAQAKYDGTLMKHQFENEIEHVKVQVRNISIEYYGHEYSKRPLLSSKNEEKKKTSSGFFTSFTDRLTSFQSISRWNSSCETEDIFDLQFTPIPMQLERDDIQGIDLLFPIPSEDPFSLTRGLLPFLTNHRFDNQLLGNYASQTWSNYKTKKRCLTLETLISSKATFGLHAVLNIHLNVKNAMLSNSSDKPLSTKRLESPSISEGPKLSDQSKNDDFVEDEKKKAVSFTTRAFSSSDTRTKSRVTALLDLNQAYDKSIDEIETNLYHDSKLVGRLTCVISLTRQNAKSTKSRFQTQLSLLYSRGFILFNCIIFSLILILLMFALVATIRYE